MKILHYTLGFSPSRSGGLVKYATDLMNEQVKVGHEVTALYPSRIKLYKKVSIESVNLISKLKIYGLVNSLPLAIFGGISNPKSFMLKCDKTIYIEFIRKVNPDIIHIHTVMGLHKEFLEAATDLNVPIVYTTHDYYGLAPEPNFFDGTQSYHEKNNLENWIRVSSSSLSVFKLRLFQSKYYPTIRKIISNLRIKKNEIPSYTSKKSERYNINEFSMLKDYYEELFSFVTGFHFNSEISEAIFKHNLDVNYEKSKMIGITNSEIQNNKDLKKQSSDKIRVAYIGPSQKFKGFDSFLELTQILDSNLYSFHTYGYHETNSIKGVIQHGKYNNCEINKIFSNIDILIVPSKWMETFGLIVLESIANRTPVYISENVGSKFLVDESFHFNSIKELPTLLLNYKKFKFSDVKEMNVHSNEIILFYKEVIQNEC